MTTPTSKTIEVAGIQVMVTDQGGGKSILLLHGGGGPQTVSGFAAMLAADGSRVITPTHPGFAGTPRPESLRSVEGLARLYTGVVADLAVTDVTIVGNSIGGWIAAEMALLDSPRIARFVLVDAVGIEVPGHPIADFFSLTPRQVAEHSYHDPDRFGIDPAKLSPEAQRVMAGNRSALTAYAGSAMSDSSLATRLHGVTRPVLVVWGDSDRIVDPTYGRAFASAIPGARFEVLADTGHLPQLESPDQLLNAIRTFVAGDSVNDRARDARL